MVCGGVTFTFTFTALCGGLFIGNTCFLKGRNAVLRYNFDECEALYLIGRMNRNEAWERYNKAMLLFNINSSLSLIASSMSFPFPSIVLLFYYLSVFSCYLLMCPSVKFSIRQDARAHALTHTHTHAHTHTQYSLVKLVPLACVRHRCAVRWLCAGADFKSGWFLWVWICTNLQWLHKELCLFCGVCGLHYTVLDFWSTVKTVEVMKQPCCPSVCLCLTTLSAFEKLTDFYEMQSDVSRSS
jgi:hypothetical protein